MINRIAYGLFPSNSSHVHLFTYKCYLTKPKVELKHNQSESNNTSYEQKDVAVDCSTNTTKARNTISYDSDVDVFISYGNHTQKKTYCPGTTSEQFFFLQRKKIISFSRRLTTSLILNFDIFTIKKVDHILFRLLI